MSWPPASCWSELRGWSSDLFPDAGRTSGLRLSCPVCLDCAWGDAHGKGSLAGPGRQAAVSELIRRAQDDGAQVVTRHGEEVAVVLAMAEFRRLSNDGRDFKTYLLTGPTVELDVTRQQDLPRDVDVSDLA